MKGASKSQIIFCFLLTGNIKWGFSDGRKPLPIEKVQSKWDKEHHAKEKHKANQNVKDEYMLTSRAVSWPKVEVEHIQSFP